MLAAAIAAPKISFETLGMIPSPRNKTMLCYCRAEDWITSLQIPSQFLEHNAELHCTRGAANFRPAKWGSGVKLQGNSR
jgi:hypothetical protein